MLHLLVWKGWGYLVVVITLGILIAVQFAVDRAFGDPHFYTLHGWPKGIGMLLSAAAIYFAARHFKAQPARTLIDKATGREFVLRREHSFMFVPMEYWTFILAAIGLVLFFVK